MKLVDELVEAVRSLADEDAIAAYDDDKIIAALNRAQMRLVRLAVRKRSELFMRSLSLSSSDFTNGEATVTPLANGVNVSHIHAVASGRYYPMSKREMSKDDELDFPLSSASVGRPLFWSLKGDKLIVKPRLGSGYTLDVRYQLRPPELVASQGRIVDYDSGANTITLDDLGSSLTTLITNLQCFVAIIDSQTGLVKGRLQISSIDTDENLLTFYSTTAVQSTTRRSSVFGYDVDITLPTDIALDDYVCIANGTCIPTLTRDYTDFLVLAAAVEIFTTMGVPVQDVKDDLRALEATIAAEWQSLPKYKRIRNSSPAWNV